MTERVHRYRSLLAFTTLLVGLGFATASRPLFLAGIVPLLYVLQGALATTSSLDDRVRVERDVRPERPLPGQPVDVTLTVENTGDSTLPDLRVVENTPDELGVAEGTARTSGVLRPGDSLTATYTVVANRGRYEFGDPLVQGQNISGTARAETTVPARGASTVECRVAADDLPIKEQTTAFSGPLATRTGGPGIEFYATREYRAGDPVKRIDWNRYAKAGDLATVEYREQRAARVVLLIDSRPPAHVGTSQALPTGATLCSYAATLALGVFLEEGHHLAVGALGTPDPFGDTRPLAWASTDESSFASRAATICNAAATEDTSTTAVERPVQTDGGRSREKYRRLLSLIPADAQVLFCTPALDDDAVSLGESLRAQGHELTVLSPQVTPASIGGRVARLDRARRLVALRAVDATVVDWERDERLPVALARALSGGLS